MCLSITSVQNSLSKEFEVDLRSYLRMVLFENRDADFCLLMGNFLLVVPTLCVALCFLIGGNVNFLWGLPLCGIMGWFLVLPSTYTLSRSSKERVAVDSLVGGLMVMLFLCSLMIPLKKTSSEKPSE